MKKTKKKVGRPLKFKDVRELKAAIDKYFEDCEKNGKPLTITGLALAIGMTSRRQLLEYEGRKEFHNAIKKAKLMCENFAEQYLFTGKNMAGAIFNLKNNYKWEEVNKIEADSLPFLIKVEKDDGKQKSKKG